jgi:hypothetical protein
LDNISFKEIISLGKPQNMTWTQFWGGFNISYTLKQILFVGVSLAVSGLVAWIYIPQIISFSQLAMIM